MVQNTTIVKIIVVDDHVLLRNAIAKLIQSFKGEYKYDVIAEAANGKDLISQLEKLNKKNLPDIVLVDINMPDMDGYNTIKWLKKNQPSIKSLVISMNDSDTTVIRALRLGAIGFLSKSVEPDELFSALHAVAKEGHYYQPQFTARLINALNSPMELQEILNNNEPVKLTDREKEFIKLICTELTYPEIAEKMSLSTRTVDGYRDLLFTKIGVKTRVGLAVWAIKNNVDSL